MVEDRLVLVHVDGGVAGPALAQRGEQSSRRYELGACRVDDERRRFHAVEMVGDDDAARLRREPHVQREHVGALEQRRFAGGARVARGGGFLQG